MKRLFRWGLLGAFLLIPGRSHAAVTFINRAGTTSGHSGTFSLAATAHAAGDLVVCGVQQQGTLSTPTVLNTAGDMWTKTPSSPQNNNGGTNYEFLFWTITAGNASDVVQITTIVSSYSTAACYSFHTSATWASPALLSDSGGQASSTNITTGSLTISAPAVVVAMLECDGQPFTAGTGYTAFVSDGAGYINDEYHITSVSEPATGTQSTASPYGIIGGAFGESGGGGASPTPSLSLTGVGPGQ